MRKITQENQNLPLTLGNLRDFLEQCGNVGIPDDAIIIDVRATFGAKLKRLAATDAHQRLDREAR
jgi:hypothetical protein